MIHAVDQGADIISYSAGGYSGSATLKEGVDYAINNGVMIIAAETMSVLFYIGFDNSLIGTDTGIVSEGTASISWLGLSEDVTYSWYVVIHDKLTFIISSIWTFNTFLDIPLWIQTPSDQIIEFGNFINYNITASDFSGIDMYGINSLAPFNIDNNGIITNNKTLSVRGYFLQVKAYDPFGNNCTASIMVYVKDTTSPTWGFPFRSQTLESDED